LEELMMGNQPFAGVKILDFSWAGVGPYSVNYLAFFGATVIKVEDHKRADVLRSLGPFKNGEPGPENSYYFAYAQTGKRYNISLNLAHPRGLEIARKLILWADVVVDSYSTGAMEKFGFDYEHLKDIKPDIIMLRTCMHGHTGPMAKQHGQGFVLTALSGFDGITGWPDRTPAGIPGAFTDYIGPQFNALALIAALDYHARTGKGQYVDNSQHESGVQLLAPLILDYTANRRDNRARGNRLEHAAPHGIYRCQGEDRWCAIAVFTDKEWQSFCKVIGNPALAEDPRFNTLTNRKKDEDALDKLVEEWTGRHSAEEVMSLLQSSGVAAGLVANAEDQSVDPQLKYYRFFETIEHLTMGKVPFHHGRCFRLSRADYEVGRATLIGEHNEYVYTHILGFSAEEQAQMARDGIT
jgi:benzylsuccinate CoA-transferase BbsF subunit